MSSDNWVLLTKIMGELQAELIRGLLEAQEIPTQLIQEGVGRVYGLSVGPLGEVEIYVPQEKFQEAESILESYDAGDFEENGEDDS